MREHWSLLWRVLRRAATNRVNLGASGVVAGAGVLAQSGTMYALACGGYIFMLAIDLARPDQWRRAGCEAQREIPELPAPYDFSDQATRDLLQRIEHARLERQNVLRAAPRGTLPPASDLLQRAARLEEHAVRALRVLDRITCQLGGDPHGPVTAEIGRLTRLAHHEERADARREYDRALAILHWRQNAIEEAIACRALVRAKLENIVAALEALPAAVVAIEARHSAAALLDDEASAELLSDELRTLEDAARAVLPSITNARSRA